MTLKKTMVEKAIKYIQVIKEIAIPLASIIFLILNTWIAGKLSPLIGDMRDIVHRIEAVEVRVNTTENRCVELRQESLNDKEDILSELKYLRSRVDNIYQIVR